MDLVKVQLGDVREQGDALGLSAACVTLVLGDEVLEEAHVVPTLVRCAVCVYDLGVDRGLIIIIGIIVGQVSSELSVRLVMIFLYLSPLVHNCSPIEFHRRNDVL